MGGWGKREGEGIREGKRKGSEGRGREGREGSAPHIFWPRTGPACRAAALSTHWRWSMVDRGRFARTRIAVVES